MNALLQRCALVVGALVAPAAAHATDMPPVEIVLIAPFLCATVVTVLLWMLLGWLPVGTTRAFLRMLVLVLLWSPVPDVMTGQLSLMPSAFAWWFASNSDVERMLPVAIAVGICAVLGACVIVVRSVWRIYASPR